MRHAAGASVIRLRAWAPVYRSGAGIIGWVAHPESAIAASVAIARDQAASSRVVGRGSGVIASSQVFRGARARDLEAAAAHRNPDNPVRTVQRARVFVRRLAVGAQTRCPFGGPGLY